MPLTAHALSFSFEVIAQEQVLVWIDDQLAATRPSLEAAIAWFIEAHLQPYWNLDERAYEYTIATQALLRASLSARQMTFNEGHVEVVTGLPSSPSLFQVPWRSGKA